MTLNLRNLRHNALRLCLYNISNRDDFQWTFYFRIGLNFCINEILSFLRMKLLINANYMLQVNIKSLEDVVRAYLKLAEEKTETAKEESQQMVLDIEDLDNIQTPERYRNLKA